MLILNVRPRSYLDAGNVVPVGSMNYPASGFGQTVSYLNLPPYLGMRERFGASVLPDPITNGPFIGARNPFGPVDSATEDRASARQPLELPRRSRRPSRRSRRRWCPARRCPWCARPRRARR